MEEFLHYLTLPYLLQGTLFTLQLTGLGFAGGLVLGIMLAWMQLSRFRVLSGAARGYTVIYRGTPLILQLVFVFTALPHIGIVLPPMVAGGVALAMNEATFFAEIFRSAVLGVDRGQLSAGRALGMEPGRLMRHIIGPQALRSMVPALGNEAVSTMKNSALASIIAVPELTLRSQQLASSTFDYFGIFFASGVMYLALTGLISVIQLLIEDALNLDRTHRTSIVSRLVPWRRSQDGTDKPVAEQFDPLEFLEIPDFPPAMDSPALSPVRPRRAPDAGTAPQASGTPLIEVSDLYKSYGSNMVLRGLNLTVNRGEVTALLGPSGSGKSTLLRTINHLETFDSGHILIDGSRLGYRSDGRSLPERQIARQRAELGVGMVFQHFNLFSHLTARQNVAAPLRWVEGLAPAAALAQADELLDRVGLADRADVLPRHLSGGQQQRVAIARTLAAKPRVLLLDEPTSALDPELVFEVLDVIRRLAFEDGLTMLIATHQLRFAREVADRVVFMASGTLVEQGPAAEVINNPQSPLVAKFLRAMGTAEL
ncbi:amino acid ABC transporter permease/ATP-binding protein [Arthrobacter sp. NPDC056886]|uniref:amino acid ABC transporter permease/ATP-binding protein n=1 Tax=Arthrobacter sp. NPDC056886 TaxID=3345960 RepID=UPI0036723D7B